MTLLAFIIGVSYQLQTVIFDIFQKAAVADKS